MVSSNLNDSIRQLALEGVEPAAIAENFGLTEAEVLVVLAARKATRTNTVIESIEKLGERAVDTIATIMDDPDAHPLVRLKAATYVADIASGIKAPATHVMPDSPAALNKSFQQFFDTYLNNVKRAQEAPSNGVILDA